ncbi:diguanylate cyclase, partial [Vibrio vulnificus]
ENSAPEYSNVTRIELATGLGATNGDHHIRIERMEFEGAYFAQEPLLFALLLSLVLFGLAFSLNDLRKSTHALAESLFRQEHLKKMNADRRAQNYECAELALRDALAGAMKRHAVRT